MAFDLSTCLARIQPVDDESAQFATMRHAALAKPAGSLGQLEDVGVRLAAITRRVPPPVPQHPTLVVAAGDHGVHAEGVTPWPQAITAIMTGVIAGGRAASTVLAAGYGVDWVVLDVGVAGEVPVNEAPDEDRPNTAGAPAESRLRTARVVEAGTRNLRLEDAMTRDEAVAAIAVGHEAAAQAIDAGCDLLVLGDMGIANTTASAALIAALTGVDAATATGRGTGIDDETLAHKAQVVADAITRLGNRREPLEILAAVGGAEHAALVGVILAGAAHRVPVVLDGVITNAAALVAQALAPASVGYCLAGHRSVEPGATVALDHLDLHPLLDLDLRLGEGTGALLAVPLVQGAARVLGQMASLADLGVD